MASMKYMSSSAALGCVLGLLARLYDWHSNRYVWMLALPAMFFAKQCCQMYCHLQGPIFYFSPAMKYMMSLGDFLEWPRLNKTM